MPVNERAEVRIMQNPGDPRVPEGVVIVPKIRVLILEDASEPPRDGYDTKYLYKNGHRPTQEDESSELKATTISGEPLDKSKASL